MKICEELERTDRFIVTNVPLILTIVEGPERMQVLFERLAQLAQARSEKHKKKIESAALYWTLSEYCQAFIRRPVDVKRRVVCLTEDQTREFWRYVPIGDFDTPEAGAAAVKVQFGIDCPVPETFRNESNVRPSVGYILPNLPDPMHGHVPDFTFRKGKPGVYYVLDEVHQHFSSRLWQKTGTQAERYMSQLRKLNDDLDLVTQHPEKVDKNFRRNATDWIQVQNMSKSPMFMGVTFHKRFRCLEYQQPEMPLRFDKPTRTTWYNLESNRRYEWLYKTAEGVGVSGGIVAEDSRFKGRHWSIWVIAVAAICVGAFFLPRVLMNTMTHLVSSTTGAFQKGVSKGVSNALPANPAYHGPEPVAAPAPAPVATPPAGSAPTIKMNLPPGFNPSSVRQAPDPAFSAGADPGGLLCTGVFQYPDGNVSVCLSDGRIAEKSYGEVQAIGRRYVRVFGMSKIPMRDAK